MNDGYICAVLTCMTMTMLVSGWKNEILGRVSGRRTALFFMCWIPGMFVTFKPLPEAGISGAFLVTVLGACILMKRAFSSQGPGFVHAASCIMLIGSCDLFFRQLERIEPAFGMFSPLVDRSILLAVLLVLSVRDFSLQFIVTTFGLAVSDWLFARMLKAGLPFVFGTPAYFDQWMLMLALARMTVMGAAPLVHLWKRAAR